jgi:iron complex outermembrane receptor protein
MRTKEGTRTRSSRRLASWANGSGIAACVGMVLQGAGLAHADASAERPGTTAGLEEIIVTASRRQEAISKAPYNVSAYGGEQLQTAHIATVAELSATVPNFTLQDTGARAAESSIPIIRGLNASQASGLLEGPRNFQSPVGMYLGNAPLIGALPLMDVERVEVLRGPQGTLYGAGTLAGAVRIVPVDPKLGSFSGDFGAGTASVSHSARYDFDVSGTVNLPIGNSAALRIAAQHQHEAGFIDQHDILRRVGGNYLNGLPVIANPQANPGDPNSPGVYFTQKDANSDGTTAARAMLLWQPSEAAKVNAAYSFAHVNGNGGPVDNHTYGGGPSPNDPTRVLGATGHYEISQASLEPFSRKTHLASLDGSYDVGFATVSGSLSYGRTNGSNVLAANRHILGIPSFTDYYAGNPLNPRLVYNYQNTDKDEVSTEELRLVSNGSGNAMDYVVGAFFQQQNRELGLYSYDPGSDAFTYPDPYGSGALYPVVVGPDGITLTQVTQQRFRDSALYGNLTYNLSARWQVTGGARVFHETFYAQQDENILIVGQPFSFPANSTSVSKPTFMLNSSYEVTPEVKAYATWS